MNRTTILLFLSIFSSAKLESQNQTILTLYESVHNLALTKLAIINSKQRFFGKLQSLSILMNFDPDGTSSLHLINNVNGVYWSDNGNCKHGQMYDPVAGCREIFCMEGYILDSNGCIPDPNFNKTSTQNQIKASSRMHIELTINHELCQLDLSNETNCSELFLTNNQNFDLKFQNFISKILGIISSRIDQVKIVSHKLSRTSKEINETSFILVSESIRVNFWILEKKSPQEKETIQLYFTLMVIAIEQYSLEFQSARIRLASVIELKKSDHLGWCGEKNENKTYISNDFRILVSFEPTRTYFVYTNSTGRFYGPGYFYLTLLYRTKLEEKHVVKITKGEHTYENIHNLHSQHNQQLWYTDFSRLNYSDVTNLIIDRNNSALEVSTILTVCDRAPKIRVNCDNFTIYRAKMCEFTYFEHNRSFCWLMFKYKCYSIDEYEFDLKEPNKYIRICQYIPNNTAHSQVLGYMVKSTLPSLTHKISSWFSLAANLISLFCMILTLITYSLFRDLRNIPGWNLINLTLALSIAQFSFFLGSFFSHLNIACFLNAILTHYGFLASFFWMNVMAFDLYRNFRLKASHILLQTQKVSDRLPKYALYAWLAPLIIVLPAIVIDLSVREPIYKVPYRPCYALYLPGCDMIRNILPGKNVCPRVDDILSKSCWIQNGRANLVFFGIPIGLIISVNAVYYFLTVFSIRRQKRKQCKNTLRRFSKNRLPGDEELKFYVQMACIMGFTWISGFLLSNISEKDVLYAFFSYLFILCNGFTGSFIFVAFICRKNVVNMYLNLAKIKVDDGNKLNSQKKKSYNVSVDTLTSSIETHS
ncbi:G- coupled [Brachionus plicatilis]|uniref:G-coupled n=1 Tax=Brachionus plicatilis TaxID=10195 RepID=A0A3M7SLU2_BRAPC|nr:G- coupled [Brachionus plicatilis]